MQYISSNKSIQTKVKLKQDLVQID